MSIYKLVDGYKHFKQNFFTPHEEEFLELIRKGNQPKTLFIGCSDSRVVPNLLLNAKPGDFFNIRNVGNIVPKYVDDTTISETAAALEYAVKVLPVEDIIVCGHTDCGACASLHKDISPEEFPHLTQWLGVNEKTKKLALLNTETPMSPDEKKTLTERISILCQLENLLTYPFIRQRVENKQIFIHGWYYKIGEGEIEYYDSETFEFRALSDYSEPSSTSSSSKG